jgi:hypothetical protein
MALDDLLRYESAAVAAMNVEKEKDISVLAMQNLYKTILGKDYDDPIINSALEEAASGGEAGITNLGVVQAMGVYSQKYDKAFTSAKMSDITKYLTDGYKVSDEVKGALGAYADLSIVDIATKLKDKELPKEAREPLEKAMKAIQLLKERRLRAATLKIYEGVVKQGLDSLYPKQEEETKESKK